MASTQIPNEVSPGIYRLGNGYVNWWLIAEHDGLVLVDAGLRHHISQLTDLLRYLGAAPSDIEACLLTHADIDHIGVAEVLRRSEGVTAFIHPDDAASVLGSPRELPQELADNLWRPWLRNTATAYERDGGFDPEFLTATQDLKGGETLELPGQPNVIHCPGHTPGSCAFHFPTKDALFTGDALVTINVLSGELGPQLLPQFDNSDHGQAENSLACLSTTQARFVLPGHGPPWADGITSATSMVRSAP